MFLITHILVCKSSWENWKVWVVELSWSLCVYWGNIEKNFSPSVTPISWVARAQDHQALKSVWWGALISHGGAGCGVFGWDLVRRRGLPPYLSPIQVQSQHCTCHSIFIACEGFPTPTCQPSWGKGTCTSEMVVNMLFFLGSPSSGPSSSSPSVVLGGLVRCGESLAWQSHPSSPSTLPHPKDKCPVAFCPKCVTYDNDSAKHVLSWTIKPVSKLQKVLESSCSCSDH